MRLTLSGQAFELSPGESVLDGLARNGVGLPAACRAGVCHACLLRAVHGDPGPPSQAGLKSSWQADGYFLACLARPAADLTIALTGEEILADAVVAAVRPIGAGVIRVLIRPRRPVPFRAGQHLALCRDGGVARVYSIANTPLEAASDGIEFHVRVYPDGAMSPWLAAAAPGTRLRIGQPSGDCCYLPGQPDGPLLLAGTGTGIAPLAAVLRDALRHGQAGPAVLIHGAADRSGLYLGTSQPDLRTCQPGPRTSQPGCGPPAPVRWRTCVQSAGADIAAVASEELARLGDPGAVRAYLCGGRRSVTRMRRALFLAGMSLKNICADEFTQAGS